MTSSSSNGYAVLISPVRAHPYTFRVETSSAVTFQISLMPGKWVLLRLSECCGAPLAEAKSSPNFSRPLKLGYLVCGACEAQVHTPPPGGTWDGMAACLAQRKAYDEWPYLPAPEEWLMELCSLLLPPLEAQAVAWAMHERLGELCTWLASFGGAFEKRVQAALPKSATYDAIEVQEKTEWLTSFNELLPLCRRLSQKRLWP